MKKQEKLRETRTVDGAWDLVKLKQSKSNKCSREGDKDGGRRGGRAFNDKTTAANDYDVFMEFYTGQQKQHLHKCQEQNLIQFFMTLLSSQWQIPNPYSFSHSSFPLRILLTWNEKLEHEICV